MSWINDNHGIYFVDDVEVGRGSFINRPKGSTWLPLRDHGNWMQCIDSQDYTLYLKLPMEECMPGLLAIYNRYGVVSYRSNMKRRMQLRNPLAYLEYLRLVKAKELPEIEVALMSESLRRRGFAYELKDLLVPYTGNLIKNPILGDESLPCYLEPVIKELPHKDLFPSITQERLVLVLLDLHTENTPWTLTEKEVRSYLYRLNYDWNQKLRGLSNTKV